MSDLDLTYTPDEPREGEARVTMESCVEHSGWVVRALAPPGEHSCSCCLEPSSLVVGRNVSLTREAPGRWRVTYLAEPYVSPGCIVGCPDPAPWEAP